MKMLSLIALLISLSWTVQADDWRHSSSHRNKHSFWHKVEDRQYVQRERMDVAIDNGQLTRREIKRLNREIQNVNQLIRKYKRLRYLEPAEKREVMACLNVVSQKIRKLSFNRHTAHRHSQRYNKHSRPHVDEREDNRRVVSWRNFPHPGDLFFRF